MNNALEKAEEGKRCLWPRLTYCVGIGSWLTNLRKVYGHFPTITIVESIPTYVKKKTDNPSYHNVSLFLGRISLVIVSCGRRSAPALSRLTINGPSHLIRVYCQPSRASSSFSSRVAPLFLIAFCVWNRAAWRGLIVNGLYSSRVNVLGDPEYVVQSSYVRPLALDPPPEEFQ